MKPTEASRKVHLAKYMLSHTPKEKNGLLSKGDNMQLFSAISKSEHNGEWEAGLVYIRKSLPTLERPQEPSEFKGAWASWRGGAEHSILLRPMT